MIEKFNERGFIAKDIIRPLIWNDSRIDFPYRQNILLFEKSEEKQEGIITGVHPDLYLDRAKVWNKVRIIVPRFIKRIIK